MIAWLRRLFRKSADREIDRIEALDREIDEALAARKADRLRRAAAARKGVSSYWAKSGENTRRLFNKGN